MLMMIAAIPVAMALAGLLYLYRRPPRGDGGPLLRPAAWVTGRLLRSKPPMPGAYFDLDRFAVPLSPMAVAPQKLRCIAIDPGSAYDIETWFVPNAPLTVSVAMAYEGRHQAVILARAGGSKDYDRFPEASGSIELPRRSGDGRVAWEWLTLDPGAWVMVPPAHIHGFEPSGDGPKLQAPQKFIRDVVRHNTENIDLAKMSPYEMGADFQLTDYRRLISPSSLKGLIDQAKTLVFLVIGGLILTIFLIFVVATDSNAGQGDGPLDTPGGPRHENLGQQNDGEDGGGR